ncbi:MAG: GNAT family N-acetyltransferase [Anaerolineae bacterium]|nr:GNAT family N-acetyltransferase [Anaerolineae bacterium]
MKMIDTIEQHIIRTAQGRDAEAILTFDHVVQEDAKRRAFILQEIEHGHCTVAEIDGQVVAYIIMDRNFFGWPFIDLVYVHSDYRQRGLAATLMQHIEAQCEEKLFVSTNLSNLRMQRLLEKLGYVISGTVHNLDEGDPEMFYFKRPVKSVGKSGYNNAQHIE